MYIYHILNIRHSFVTLHYYVYHAKAFSSHISFIKTQSSVYVYVWAKVIANRVKLCLCYKGIQCDIIEVLQYKFTLIKIVCVCR